MSDILKSRIAIGAAWLIAVRIADRLIGLISIGILARLLLPTDFGLVAYAMTFYGILQLFFLISVETFLISDKNATKSKYDTAWTMEIIKGIIISIAIVVSAEWVATFFEEPEVEYILYWFALVPLLFGFENIGTVNFQKDLEFNREFFYLFTVRVSAAIITITLAFLLRSHWALVYGTVATGVLRFLLSYLFSSYRPSLSLSEIRAIFNFSQWLLLHNILSGLNERFPAIILGRYLEPSALSFFGIAMEISTTASAELAAPVRRALFPGIATISHDRAEMQNIIKKTIGVVVLIGFPIAIGVTVTAPLIVPVLLGDNWSEVIPVIQMLGILASSYILYSNSHVVYYSVKRPDITAKLSILKFCFVVPSCLYLIPEHGAVGAALAIGISYAILQVIDYVIFIRFLDLNIYALLRETWRSLVGVAVMALFVITLISYFQNLGLSNLVILLASSFLGALIYIALVLALWFIFGSGKGPEAYVINLVGKGFNRYLKRA